MKWSKIFILSLLFFSGLVAGGFARAQSGVAQKFWVVQSVDTVKYSRDVAREMITNPAFDDIIERQVRQIAEVGATHISIGTPYDEEFLPFLERWVAMARRYDLNVWFRGNWSGWEGWFGYTKINRQQHITKTEQFILKNKKLFRDGDIFTACPECENGGPGDPRRNGDVRGHRDFIIEEYRVTKSAFEKIDRQVVSNYVSMNGDVASLVMDKETTSALDGIVTVDHYVKNVDKLVADIRRYAEQSGGRVVLGEWGAPIPDLHGNLTPDQQANWVREALERLVALPELVGLNYWVNVGGSTSIWTDKGAPKPAAGELATYYQPPLVSGFVHDELDRPISGALVGHEYASRSTNAGGYFEIPYVQGKNTKVTVEKEGYAGTESIITPDVHLDITLEKQYKGFFFRLFSFLKRILL